MQCELLKCYTTLGYSTETVLLIFPFPTSLFIWGQVEVRGELRVKRAVPWMLNQDGKTISYGSCYDRRQSLSEVEYNAHNDTCKLKWTTEPVAAAVNVHCISGWNASPTSEDHKHHRHGQCVRFSFRLSSYFQFFTYLISIGFLHLLHLLIQYVNNSCYPPCDNLFILFH